MEFFLMQMELMTGNSSYDSFAIKL